MMLLGPMPTRTSQQYPPRRSAHLYLKESNALSVEEIIMLGTVLRINLNLSEHGYLQ